MTNRPINLLIDSLLSSDIREAVASSAELHHPEFRSYFQENPLILWCLLFDDRRIIKKTAASLIATNLDPARAREMLSTAIDQERDYLTQEFLREQLNKISRPDYGLVLRRP